MDLDGLPRYVVIVVVPQKDIHPAVIRGRSQHADVRRAANTLRYDLSERHLTRAARFELFRTQPCEQSKDIQDRQIETVGRQLAITGEPRLTDEGERP